ncbi:hypothetical protein AY578_27150 [Streptomyces thermocarboxydus]|uniref:hypothetical protein n=1 Tax=Streptomyces thermocarboxydus TaxID=59299 RepID=UPI0021644D1C|nr:hypothetical protein AY578_27150 [Streptomyces thermocarboxydus]
MAAEQLPEAVREFTDHLRDLLARLDRYAGWCLVFWQRDPDGMRACLEGREPPPWDVVESLLQDLAAVHGPAAADAELPRSRALHAGATAAFDARPGARQALSDRLDVMLREQRYAADRRAGLTRRLAAAATREEAESLGNDLAWAEDDHRRATARCAEITARMAALDEHTPGPGPAHTQTRWAASPAADAQAVAGPQGPHMTSAGQGTGPNPAPDGRGITESPGPARTPGVPQAGPAREGHGPASVPGHRYAVGGGPNPVAEGRGSARTPGGPHAGLAREGRAPAAVPDHRNGGGAPASAPDGRGAAQAPGVPQVGPARQGHGPAGPRPAVRPVPGPGRPCPGQAPGAPKRAGHDETAYLHGGPGASHRRPGPENPAATGRDPLAAPEPTRRPTVPLPPDPSHPSCARRNSTSPRPPRRGDPPPRPQARRGGARFAGWEDDGRRLSSRRARRAGVARRRHRRPRARFAGAAAEAGADEPPPEERVDAEDLREVGHLVRTLTRLRREGRSGDAHVLLNEAAYWPAVRLPLLAAEMERAGLGADWATLLWEAAATLPAERLVGAADALAAGGRAEDGEQILRQGVVRPADEIGHAALALADGTRHRELRALLDACVRTRTPQDAARTAAPDPGRLVPLLLTAARAVSEERHWDVLHALRVAGLAA